MNDVPKSDTEETKPKTGLLSRLFGRKAEPAALAPAAPEPPPLASEPTAETPEIPAETPEPLIETAAPTEAVVTEVAPSAIAEEAPPPPKKSWWARLTSGLARSSQSLGSGLTEIFAKRKLDATTLDDLEDMLIRADLGVAAALRIRDEVAKGRYEKGVDVDSVKAILAAEVERVLAPLAIPLEIDTSKKPFVILVVGVNGSGKTTTIGKLAAKFHRDGRKMLARRRRHLSRRRNRAIAGLGRPARRARHRARRRRRRGRPCLRCH